MAPLSAGDARGFQCNLRSLEHGVVGAAHRGVHELGLEAQFGGPEGFDCSLELHGRQRSFGGGGLSKGQMVTWCIRSWTLPERYTMATTRCRLDGHDASALSCSSEVPAR